MANRHKRTKRGKKGSLVLLSVLFRFALLAGAAWGSYSSCQAMPMIQLYHQQTSYDWANTGETYYFLVMEHACCMFPVAKLLICDLNHDAVQLKTVHKQFCMHASQKQRCNHPRTFMHTPLHDVLHKPRTF